MKLINKLYYYKFEKSQQYSFFWLLELQIYQNFQKKGLEKFEALLLFINQNSKTLKLYSTKTTLKSQPIAKSTHLADCTITGQFVVQPKNITN